MYVLASTFQRFRSRHRPQAFGRTIRRSPCLASLPVGIAGTYFITPVFFQTTARHGDQDGRPRQVNRAASMERGNPPKLGADVLTYFECSPAVPVSASAPHPIARTPLACVSGYDAPSRRPLVCLRQSGSRPAQPLMPSRLPRRPRLNRPSSGHQAHASSQRNVRRPDDAGAEGFVIAYLGGPSATTLRMYPCRSLERLFPALRPNRHQGPRYRCLFHRSRRPARLPFLQMAGMF